MQMCWKLPLLTIEHTSRERTVGHGKKHEEVVGRGGGCDVLTPPVFLELLFQTAEKVSDSVPRFFYSSYVCTLIHHISGEN